jgi:hexosaminidase
VIHIGGDEVPKDRWKACAACQALMTREGLANEEELQSWFMRQVAQHVATRGRRVIGWDEVMDGPYVKGGTVQSWRDASFTRIAAQRDFDVIASPSDFTYLNRSASELRVADVYRFDPLPASLDAVRARRVRGGEVPLWSEHIVSGANLELMALPRLLAFADALWTSKARDYAELSPRLRIHEAQLRAAGYAVGPREEALASIAVRYDSISQRPVLQASTFSDQLVVRGTSDGTTPRATSAVYRDGTPLAAASVIRLQAFWGAERVREERRVTLVRHAAVGARVRTEPAVDARYPGTGAYGLVDGMTGSGDHGDGLWQGWWKPEVTITLELPRDTDVASLRVNFLQNTRSWILLPRTVAFAWSTDGVSWSAPRVISHTIPVSREGAIVQAFDVGTPAGTRVRFVRIAAKAGGNLPAGHPGAGQPAWLFADEVIVRARRAVAAH